MAKTIKITSLSQLDALVDEKVMEQQEEYVLLKRGYFYRPNAAGYTDRIAEAGRYSLEEAQLHEYPHDEPVTKQKIEPLPYSTDIAAAWPVVEKMKERGLWPAIVSAGRHGLWRCETCDDLKEGKTAPLAICLCALASVGIEVKLEIEA